MEIVNSISAEPVGGDSLKKRYAYKLGLSVAGSPLSLASQAIIPRLLGPAALGNYGFLTNFFSQLIAFFDAGLSAAFYSKLSQRRSEGALVRFFWELLCIISSLVLVAVVLVFLMRWQDWLWPNQKAFFVWLALIWGMLTWYSQTVNKILDAYGLTVQAEAARFLQKVVAAGLLAFMLWIRWSGLRNYFIYQYIMLALLILGWWFVMRKRGYAICPRIHLSASERSKYGKEFYAYSSPLFGLAIAGLITGLLDRWLLQQFAGSVEQGFYSFSYQLGAICFVFAGAMTPLFWRDYAKAVGENDFVRMKILFERLVPKMYWVVGFFSLFMAVQAGNVSLLWGGSEFRNATVPVAIMALYPLHQTYGQLTSTVFFSTGRTRAYRNLGLGGMALGLGLTFWLLAPRTLLGLNLGATGLALKMVLVQVVFVNAQLWFVVHSLGLPFSRFLWHQFYVFVLLACTAWMSSALAMLVISNTLFAFLLSGLFYAIFCTAIILLLPNVVSMTSSELHTQINIAWQRVKKVLNGI